MSYPHQQPPQSDPETHGGHPGGVPPQQQAGLQPWPGGSWPPQPGYPGGMPPSRPRRTGVVIGIVAAALLGLGGGVALTLAFTSKDSSGPAFAATSASSVAPSPSAPSVDPDPFSAQAGDCIHANRYAGTNGEFSGSAIRVPCSAESANYVVVAQLPTSGGSECNSVPGWPPGGQVVYDFNTSKSRELCVKPKE